MSAHGDPDSPSHLLSGKVSFPPPQRLQRVPVSHTHWQNLPALWTLFSHPEVMGWPVGWLCLLGAFFTPFPSSLFTL